MSEMKIGDKAQGLDSQTAYSPVRTAQKSSSKSYIPTLDGWRAIAVGLVIGAHSDTMLLNNGSFVARHAEALFSHAGIGVDIFFCLSGYLICTTLLREKQKTNTISMSRFYTRRVFRIVPPILLYLLALIILWKAGALPPLGRKEFLAALFFYRNYVGGGNWYTGHFWSLAIEEHFYVLAPIFLLVMNRKWAIRCASVLIIFCIGIRCLEYYYGMFPDSLLQFRTENRYDGLLWGMMLAFALDEVATRAWLQKHLTAFVCVVAILLSALLLAEFSWEPIRRTVVAAAMPILIGYTVLHTAELPGKFLELSALRWIGRLSYSLYIWQQLFLTPESRPLGIFQDFPLNLICAFGCAVASYYALERPMIKLGHRLANAPGAQPTLRYE